MIYSKNVNTVYTYLRINQDTIFMLNVFQSKLVLRDVLRHAFFYSFFLVKANFPADCNIKYNPNLRENVNLWSDSMLATLNFSLSIINGNPGLNFPCITVSYHILHTVHSALTPKWAPPNHHFFLPQFG